MMSSGAISDFIGMLPAMKMTDPYSPTARANARAKPVSRAGHNAGRMTRAKVCHSDAPSVAAACSTSLSNSSNTGCKVLTTNGKPMKMSAMTTPKGVNATWIPSGCNPRPNHPLGAYRAVSAMPATAVGSANGKSTMASMSRLNGNRYRTKTHAMTSPNTALTAAASSAAPKLNRSEATTLGAVTTAQKCPHPESRLRKNVADKGIKTINDRYSMVYPSVSPNPGITRRERAARPVMAGGTGTGPVILPESADGAALLTIDSIERAVVGEVRRLRFGPAAESRVDGHERDARKLGCILRGDFRIARAVKMLGGYFLTLLGIEIAQILLRDLARPVLVDHLVDHTDRRFRENAQGRGNHIELIRTQLFDGEIRFVLPREQYVADAAFHKRHGGPARARIQHGHILVQLFHERLRSRLATAGLLQRPRPGREIVPAGPARGLRTGRDHRHPGTHQIAPVANVFGVALAYEKHDGRRVRRAVCRQARLPVGRDQLRLFGQGVDVVGKRQRHHVGTQTVDDGTRLLAGTSVALVDDHSIAGLSLPIFRERLVVIVVQLACRIVGYVQQAQRGGLQRRGGAEANDEQRGCRNEANPSEIHR